jgi:hypothetical protein
MMSVRNLAASPNCHAELRAYLRRYRYLPFQTSFSIFSVQAIPPAQNELGSLAAVPKDSV